MAKFRHIKNSFIGGEISPTAFGRTDLPLYNHACKTMRNMIPMSSGGAYRRPGTFFETSLATATEYAPRLFPFIYSREEAYCIVLNKATGGSYQASVYRPTSCIATSQSGTVNGSHPYTAYAGAYDPLADVQFCQSADVMYLVHPDYIPQRIYRTAQDTFRTTNFDYNSAGSRLTGAALRDAWPYEAVSTTGTTLTASATTGTITVTPSGGTFVFTDDHVGLVFKTSSGAGPTYGCFRVTSQTGGVATAVVEVTLGNVTNTVWWEPAWSPAKGWPRAICFYQDRLIYGGTKKFPDSFFCSQTASYNTLSKDSVSNPVSDPTGTQPFQKYLLSREVNEIQWLSPGKSLQIGTLGSEWIISLLDPASGFVNGNLDAVEETKYGSSHHMAFRGGNETFFAVSSDDEVLALVYSDNELSYVAESVQVMFDEYPKAPAIINVESLPRKYREFSWDNSRKTLWCVDTAGNLFGLTRDRRLGITAWHSHEFGGADETLYETPASGKDPVYSLRAGGVVSHAVVPNPVLGMNDVWLCVKRKINGDWSYHIERFMGKGVVSDTAYKPAIPLSGNYFSDASVYSTNDYPSPETFTLTGINHLKGEELAGTANDARLTTANTGLFAINSDAVDGSGNAVLNSYPVAYEDAVFLLSLGLPFDSYVEILRPEAGSQIGTAQGAMKRVHKVFARLYRTISCRIGRDLSNTEIINFRAASLANEMSPELFTGDKEVLLNTSYDRDSIMVLLQDEPLPFAISALILEGVTHD